MFESYEIELYKTNTGKEPFNDWLESLDKNTFGRIDARMTRLRQAGNFGVCEPVGDGVYELKFDFGPGYRAYFGYQTDTILVFLFGGHKKGQQKNIDKAKEYWRDHLSLKRGKK